MKLPTVQYTGVQSLGRNNLGATGNVAHANAERGNVMQKAAQSIAAVSADYIRRKEDAQYNDVVANTAVEKMRWLSQHSAKQSYSADEIPNGIGDDEIQRIENVTSVDGYTTESRIRDNIPAHEVFPILLREKLKTLIETNAAKISNPIMRNQYLRNAEMDAAESLTKATIAAEVAQQKYIYEEGVYKADQAAETGDMDLAAFIIDNLETSQTNKDKLIDAAGAKVETYQVNQTIRSTDPNTVLTMRTLLDDENYGGSLSESQRQAAIADLNTRLKQLSNERDLAEIREHDVFISDSIKRIDEFDLTLSDVEAGHDRWKDSEGGDVSGYSPQERTRLRSLIRSRDNALNTKRGSAMNGQMILNGSGSWNNSDHQKWIDDYVEVNQVTDLEGLVDVTIKSNIMPKWLTDMFNVAANTNMEATEDSIAPGLMAYGKLVDTDEFLNREIPSGNRELLNEAHILYRSGFGAVESMRMARETANVPPEIREQRDRDYSAFEDVYGTNGSKLEDFMEDDNTRYGFNTMDTWDQNIQPNTPMMAEFERNVRTHFARTGDLGRAQKLAWMGMQETWSPSAAGGWIKGDEVVQGKLRPQKYAPERVHQASTEDINNRLGAFAEEKGLEVDNLMIVSDPYTARNGTYAIMEIDPETGLGKGLYEDGNTLRIDFTKYDQRKGTEWKSQENFQAEKARREAAVAAGKTNSGSITGGVGQ